MSEREREWNSTFKIYICYRIQLIGRTNVPSFVKNVHSLLNKILLKYLHKMIIFNLDSILIWRDEEEIEEDRQTGEVGDEGSGWGMGGDRERGARCYVRWGSLLYYFLRAGYSSG